MDLSHDDSPEAELPSCSGCRKRKLKCSRQRPACSNCERLGAPCVYENRRTKPGLKGGAVESLNQRLEKVEKALFGSALEEGTRDSEGTNCHLSADRTSSSSSAPLEAILSTLAGELQKLNKNIEPTRKRQYEYDPYRKVHALFKRQRRDIAQEQHQSSNGDITHQRTRQASVCRIDIVQNHLDKLLEAHFDNIQPWIPMIGNGNLEKAWPIVGSLTRTVEYMGLSVEPEMHERKRGLLSDSSSLPEPRDWLEEEERRRIFWNIFILDRISSIIKGWNPGIDSEDVRRRLPICGGSWFHNEPAVTPYFGNWGQPAAQSGHGTSPCYSVGSNAGGAERPASAYSIRASDRTHGDISKIGALAYYIQSIDSLSQISKTFLQPAVDFTNRQEVSLWLTKFKELDLRLVHMTLANATHNTSVILLHERIAYPDSELLGLNLPSQFSAQNCLNAAIETANITTKYLGGSPSARPVPPQMGICAFVSARTLLVHSQYYNAPLSKEFQILMDNLTDMSNRWAGLEQVDQTKKTSNFFDQLFNSLQSQHQHSQRAATGQSIPGSVSALEVEGPIFSSRLDTSGAARNIHAPTKTNMPPAVNNTVNNLTPGMHYPDQLSNEQWHVDSQSPTTISRDDLFIISQTLMNNDFLELDRIISFEDMMAVGNMSQYYGTNS
ncbi:hypothetical protein BFJ68_g14085 [Fusarium oxysporum]|uniref:Zn(2)-C6 fungal-type domain-containing protein n=1 Tax=Fusarium oxysporum TaxID=5507 RepID=A0A420PXT5_FUSOX|nr:hypothetical protein BFJ68_g14085 [Fusarium oxysporum]